MLLEVCAYSIQSCLIAQQAGAGRIEFCADPLQGGTTPSHGALSYVREHITIPVFPMIRPRGGSYLFDTHELEIIKRDILHCRSLGFTGIACGVQLPDGRIDIENLKRITEWAYPMAVTCHKVFDEAPDPIQALEDVIAAGCKRILTSGLEKTAIEGIPVLKQLVVQAADRIVIMPGGSARSSNISRLIQETGANEYHSSCIVNGNANYTADINEVSAAVSLLS